MAIPATDALSAALALCGLALAVRRLDGPDPLSRAFRAALVLVAAFLAARVGHWVTGRELLRAVNLAAGALIPLGALVLAEVLVRRHAPAPVKWGVAGGAAILALAFLLWGPSRGPAGSMALGAFQAGALVAAALLVLLRDRARLAPDENGLIDRVSLALPFVLPFLLSDHDLGLTETPLRLSGVAILLLCWIGLGLRRHGRPRATALAVAVTLGLATVAAAVLAARLPLPDALRLWGALASAMILAALLRDEAEGRGSRRAVLPAPGEADAARYLDGLRARGALDDVVLVAGPDLDDFDAGALGGLLARGPVALGDLPPHGRGSLAESQLRVLLERFEATGAHLLASAPLRLALVRAAGPLGARPDPDLQMAFALARALPERPAP